MQVDVLKEEVASLSREVKREGINLEYVKNIIVKFMLSEASPGSVEHTGLVDVISDLLEFTPEDRRAIADCRKKLATSNSIFGWW